MTLRRKLLTLFGGLALLSLLIAGTTFWSTHTQQEVHRALESQLMRSLLLERVQSTGLLVLRGQFAAVITQMPGARDRFEELDRRVASDLDEWAALAQEPAEEEHLTEIRTVYEELLVGVRAILDDLDAGEVESATDQMIAFQTRAEANRFREATRRAADAFEADRARLRAQVERTRDTIQTLLLVAAIVILSIVFLFAAYLASELFRPLRDLRDALDRVAQGDFDARVDDGRDDELGEIGRAFNRMVETVALVERSDELEPGARVTTRAALQRQVRRLVDAIAAGDEAKERVESLARALGSFAEIALPTDLELRRVRWGAFLNETLGALREPLDAMVGGVRVELSHPEVEVELDVGKLRAILRALIQRSLDAEATTSPALELRAGARGSHVWLELELDDAPSVPSEEEISTLIGDVVAAHEGRIEIDAEPGSAFRVRIELPSIL